MQFNKLVRDNIPEIIAKNGEQAIVHVANDDEYEAALYEKVVEEVNEFKNNPSVEEMADIQEVLLSIAKLKKISPEEVEKIRQEKAAKRGGFDKRIILESTDKV